jgi:ATP-dependent DNA helicase RecQ
MTAPRPTRTQVPDLLLGESQDLFEELRSLRRRLAGDRGLPAYMVFNDATLKQMATQKPATYEQLLAVNGVGAKKIETYGDDFLEAIRNWTSA